MNFSAKERGKFEEGGERGEGDREERERERESKKEEWRKNKLPRLPLLTKNAAMT